MIHFDNTYRNRDRLLLAGLLWLIFTIVALFIYEPKAATVSAQGFEQITVQAVNDADSINSLSPVYTTSVTLGKNANLSKEDNRYLTFNLSTDSWVYFTGNYSYESVKGTGTDIWVYSDAGMTKKVLECGIGMWRFDNEAYNFLKKGTYYIRLRTTLENYDEVTSTMNILAESIPVSKLINIKKKVKSGKTVVTFKNALGSYAKAAQYQKGKVKPKYNNSKKHWKYYIHSANIWTRNPKKANLLKDKGNRKYTFTVKNTGKYTVLIEDLEGNRYSKTFKIKVK